MEISMMVAYFIEISVFVSFNVRFVNPKLLSENLTQILKQTYYILMFKIPKFHHGTIIRTGITCKKIPL